MPERRHPSPHSGRAAQAKVRQINWRRVSAAFVLVAVLAGSGPRVEALGLRERLRLLLHRRQVKKLKARQVKRKLQEVKRQQRSVAADLEETQQELEAASKELRRVTGNLRATEQDLREVTEDLNEVQRRLEAHEEALGERLVGLYKYGSLNYLDLLLNSETFSDFVKRSFIFRCIIRSDQELLGDIERDREEIRAKRLALRVRREKVRGLRVAVASRRETVIEQQSRQQRILNRIVHERAAYEQYFAELEASSRAIERMIVRLTAVRRRPGGRFVGRSTVIWHGGFIAPVPGGVTSSFGSRLHPILRVVKPHTGVDLRARYGASVRASAGGTVLYSGWMRGYGRTVVVDHGNGLSTVYAHLSSAAVGRGRRVTQGESIGRVGSTGFSTGPHLHFEVRRNGRPVNPRRW